MLYKIAPLSVIQDIKKESLHVKWLSLAFISAVVLKLTHLLQRNWILSLGGRETTLAGQMVPGGSPLAPVKKWPLAAAKIAEGDTTHYFGR